MLLEVVEDDVGRHLCIGMCDGGGSEARVGEGDGDGRVRLLD